MEKFKRELKIKGEVYLRVKVRPASARNLITEIMDDKTVKINIAAQPIKGKANQELIKFLAKEFSTDKDKIEIISGKTEKIKLIKIIK